MVLTKKHIQKMRLYGLVSISKELEQILRERLGTEPEPYEYSEQDIAEQSRKIIQEYQRKKEAER
jgi:hypothetical protein